MFTGIIENLGTVVGIEKMSNNIRFTIQSEIASELKIDQSVAHNGVCLTVVEIIENCYKLDAVNETLQKTNLGTLKIGDIVNIERCMVMNGRIDGHIVQGHVDQTASVQNVIDEKGSWKFSFKLNPPSKLIVEKGSICINGVSLTAFDVSDDSFSVAIIPYTFENTSFKNLIGESIVNIEFDIIGKYVQRLNIN
jgi:riboflavin synthase